MLAVDLHGVFYTHILNAAYIPMLQVGDKMHVTYYCNQLPLSSASRVLKFATTPYVSEHL